MAFVSIVAAVAGFGALRGNSFCIGRTTRLSRTARTAPTPKLNYGYKPPVSEERGVVIPKASTTESDTPTSLDADALLEKANEFGTDVGARPGYYGKLVLFGFSALVGLKILQSVVAAVDSIPILPSLLELIGLGYTAWFVWRYVIFKESREELMAEIEDFMGKARPDSS